MKILFLFPYPSGTAASQRFRFEQYLDFLREEGIQVDLQAFIDEKTWRILYKPGHYLPKILGIIRGFLRRIKMLFRLGSYDFVFVHREASPLGPPVFEWLIARVLKKKLIFDFDDAIWLPNTTDSNALVARLKFHQKTAWISRYAHKVSVGNAYLGEYAAKVNPRGVVLNPTTIDTEHLHNRLRDQSKVEKTVIGWTGTHSTLKYLDDILPVLQELEARYAFDFLVISNRHPEFQLRSLVFKPWNKATEMDDLLLMHIGLMPLSDDIWAKGKCGFKALQYMALGIPALVSPVGVNTEIVEDGIQGFVCKDASDWKKAIIRLIEQPELRQTMGLRARQKIVDTYSVQSNRDNFRALFE
ncbi:MAG: glycosyltransferase family 4 protein [Microscillaceae bacterium]|nr:glycosyltransferase family 4 protein [Microscillaceae bacterium]